MKRCFFEKIQRAFSLCVLFFGVLTSGVTAAQGVQPPENFSAVMFSGAEGNAGVERSAATASPRSLNPVFHWHNITSEDLREGASRTFVLTSNHPMTFSLEEMKVVEKPENLAVTVSPAETASSAFFVMLPTIRFSSVRSPITVSFSVGSG